LKDYTHAQHEAPWFHDHLPYKLSLIYFPDGSKVTAAESFSLKDGGHFIIPQWIEG